MRLQAFAYTRAATLIVEVILSANRIFLVCSAHPNIEDALCIADRPPGDSRYYCASNCRCLKCKCAEKARDQRGAFFAKHANCGVDQYSLAYHRPKGWDVSPPAQDTPAGAVRLALVDSQAANGSGH